MHGAAADYPPPRKPPKIASRQPSAQPSDNASRPRLVANIPITSTRKKNMTISEAAYHTDFPLYSCVGRDVPTGGAPSSRFHAKWLQAVCRRFHGGCTGRELQQCRQQAMSPGLLVKQLRILQPACCNLVAHRVGEAENSLSLSCFPDLIHQSRP